MVATRKRRRSLRVRFLVLVGVILGFTAIAPMLFADNIEPVVPMPTEEEAIVTERPLRQLDVVDEPASTTGLVPTNMADIVNAGYLALINRQHAISAEPDFSLLTSAWPAVPVSTIYGMYLHLTALRAVEEMFSSAREAGIGTLFVSSGFRGYERQTELYGGGANKAFVLPPGHSEHHTGLAMDILAVGIGMSEMANSAEGRWLADNSYRYGLILRYPDGAQDITGIEFEPWHFRYVGRPHAYFMRQNNLVLEEYIKLIQSYGSLSFEKNGVVYYVLHQVPQNGMINLPDKQNLIISSDNMGGYIVTAWR